MRVNEIWLDVGKRIHFYTKETRSLIPEKAGIYAWFIPLYLFTEDIEEFLSVINGYLLYDSYCKGIPEKEEAFKFSWHNVDVRLRQSYYNSISPELVSSWKKLIADPESKESIKQTLMEASIFLSPLYVGKTKNLKDRYDQHVSPAPLGKNIFNQRFSEHAKNFLDKFALRVSDLLFVCILTKKDNIHYEKAEDITTFLEKLLIRLCKPVFSEK